MNDNVKKIFVLFILTYLTLANLQANEKAQLITQDFAGENALHDAVRANDIKAVEYIINQGIDINKQNEYGYTALHLAVRLHQFDITSYLIAKDAKINTIDEYEDTPLIDATRNNDTNIAKVLICNGANRNVEDAHGITAIQNSAANKNQIILNLLRTNNLKQYCQVKHTETVADSDKLSNIEDNMLKIKINPASTIRGKKPTICGEIIKGKIIKGKISIINKEKQNVGTYPFDINQNEQSWCSLVTKELENGTYTVKAEATAENGKQAYDNEEFMLYIIPNLYTALMNEFSDDMKIWDAHLDENTLVFTFRDINGLYEVGSSDLKKKFKEIIDTFLPRYVKITSQYKEYIKNIVIEGHSSSEASGKTKEEKFEFNKILSEQRAEKVLDHANKIINQDISDNILWVLKTFKSDGLSSSELIYDSKGQEDRKQSRRVEFRIINDYSNIKNEGY